MKQKLLLLFLVLLTLNLSLFAQNGLSLRDKLKSKTWYAIKIFWISDHTSGISKTTEFAYADGKNYLFSLTASNSKLTRNISSDYFNFPRELTIESDNLVYYSPTMDNSTKKVTYKVNYSTEDFLEIEDYKETRYFFVSDRANE